MPERLKPSRESPFASRRASIVFGGVVFLTTAAQVLAVPIAALLDGRGEWVLPISLTATILILLLGCAAQSVALVLSGRMPRLAVAGTTIVYLGLIVLLGVPTWLQGMHLVMALALFLFATRASVAQALTWLVATLLACVVTLFAWLASIGTEPSVAVSFVLAEGVRFVAPSAGATALGIWWAIQNRKMTAAREQYELERQEQDRRVRRAQEEERARIAQEVHDVAGQHLAGLVTLADAAVKLAPTRPDDALRLVDEVRREGRFAAASLTGALADLRAAGTAPTETTPDLRRLHELVSYWERRGMTIEQAVAGDVSDLPAVVSTTIFRVLQEALTNAAKHASGAAVQLSVTVGATILSIRVANGPGADLPGQPTSVGLGWGLGGIQERVNLLNGTATAGRTTDGGWLLSVSVPITVGAS